jgi:hypothetical protein
VRKGTPDDTTTSITLQDTTGLDLALAANTTYTFEYYILFQTSATTRGISLSLTGPATSVLSYTVSIPRGADGTASVYHGTSTGWDQDMLSDTVEVADTTYVARIAGVVRTTAAGTLKPRFRSENAAATARVMTYSWGQLSTP